ncbi:type II secretion system minor pseudopilin GspK [Phorcysia thermohydrogeniphila]|uniref:type II secretion system minor pseudopilin GspK n=1 Tax=Phorcysia thermohydrogeniphila TaxID=936138 RepID=UPI00104F7534|nr:type II secretion system minor pseudopilin GspK [Phorcysia thermohydrogeniphila]
MRKRFLSSSGSRKGFVLFLVLVMVSVTASFLFSLYYVSTLNFKKAESFRDYTVAYHAAVSAVKLALYFLRNDNNGFDGIGDDWASPFYYNYRGISVSIRIEDECGKINVNNLKDNRWYGIAQRLFEKLELNVDLADALRDWIDGDDEVFGNGAESFYYEGLGYRPSNVPMKSIYELFYVKGVDDRVFKKLRNYLTVYGGKVNVNSAPKEVLLALSPQMGEDAVDSIIENRPIKDLTKLKELPGFDEELYFEIKPLITVRCNYFRIEATAHSGDTTATVEAYANRYKVLEWKVVQ